MKYRNTFQNCVQHSNETDQLCCIVHDELKVGGVTILKLKLNVHLVNVS